MQNNNRRSTRCITGTKFLSDSCHCWYQYNGDDQRIILPSLSLLLNTIEEKSTRARTHTHIRMSIENEIIQNSSLIREHGQSTYLHGSHCTCVWTWMWTKYSAERMCYIRENKIINLNKPLSDTDNNEYMEYRSSTYVCIKESVKEKEEEEWASCNLSEEDHWTNFHYRSRRILRFLFEKREYAIELQDNILSIDPTTRSDTWQCLNICLIASAALTSKSIIFLHHASICFLWWTWVDCEHTGRKHHLLSLLLLRDIDNRYLKSEMPDFFMHMLLSHPVRRLFRRREECSNKLMMINDGWKHVLIRCSS